MRAVTVGQLGDQTVAVTGGDDGTLLLWRHGPGGLIGIPNTCIPVGSPPVGVALFPAGKTLAWCHNGVLTAAMSTSQALRMPRLRGRMRMLSGTGPVIWPASRS